MIRNVAIDEMADDQPEEYMTFFSLRGWGKHKSGVLTTEQVYIHGKTCIIDDRESHLQLVEPVEVLEGGLTIRSSPLWICQHQREESAR